MAKIQELRGAALPARLRELSEPPEQLFLVGELPRGPVVGIVGTRTPTAAAAQYAGELSCYLAARGVAIASGGAEGIDTQAHRGALDAGGVTIVVAPSSLDRPYPEKNAELFERVVRQGGALVSSFPEGTPAAYPRFFERNAQLAALSDVLVVVETRLRGGARNAAKWARRLGRPIFAVPTVPWNATGYGCLLELKLGARLLCSPEDVLRALADRNAHPVAVGLPPWRQLSLLHATERGEELLEPFVAEGIAKPRPRARRSGRRATPAALGPGEGEAERQGGSTEGVGGRTTSLPAPKGDAGRVWRAVAESPRHPDEICEATALPPGRVRALLLELALAGRVEVREGGQVAAVGHAVARTE